MLTRPAERALLERRIAAIWCDELALEDVQFDDDFLALGGTSLNAMRIVARTEELVGAQLSVRTLFDTLTVRGMAAAVADAVQQPEALG
jgi:nonribosomal peptide synthetase protein BlmIV